MYLDHFGLSEPPFTITPHTEFFFAGANRGATLDALIYAITHGEGIVKVSGEVGSGKTMLCRVLMERLPDSVATIYLAIPSLNRDEMLQAICADLGIETGDNGPNTLLKRLQEHLLELHAAGKSVVALIDEAHAMPLESLEEIRLLSNLETNKSKLLQIVLFGQPELDENLAKPQMRQLRERITHSFRLSPLTLEDVHEYLRHRLRAAGYKGAEVFNAACVKLIYKTSIGLSRRINIIADKSLLAAFSSNTHSVSPAHVKAAIRDSEFSTALKPDRTPWLIGGSLTVGLVVGVLLTAGWIATHPVPANSLSQPTQTPEAVAKAPPSAPPPSGEVNPSPMAVSQKIASSASADTLPDRLAASKIWLSQETPSHWVIQLILANANETGRLLGFIHESEQSLGADRIHAYPLTLGKTAKVSVVYGSFTDRNTALAAFNKLPTEVRQFKPYLRSIQMIRLEAGYPNPSQTP